jgi:hypothetical protein
LIVGVCKLMIVPNNNDNIENKKFIIQYTKKELDNITVDFVTHLSKYIAKVTNRIIKTFEEIEKESEVEQFPPISTK